jgi:hypothetical protein
LVDSIEVLVTVVFSVMGYLVCSVVVFNEKPWKVRAVDGSYAYQDMSSHKHAIRGSMPKSVQEKYSQGDEMPSASIPLSMCCSRTP